MLLGPIEEYYIPSEYHMERNYKKLTGHYSRRVFLTMEELKVTTEGTVNFTMEKRECLA